MAVPLTSLRISGFRSVAGLVLPLSSEVTLLVGANGSGKSNIIAAFELLGRIVDGSIQEDLLRRGGLAAQLHRSARGDDAHHITLETWGETVGSYSNGYRVQLLAGPDDSALLQETTYTHNVDKYPEPFDNPLGLSRTTRLRQAAEHHPANKYVLDVLSGARVFHFDDTSPDAPALRRASLADNLSLHSDAANLASVLYGVRNQDRRRYDRIVRSIQAVTPFFDDFVLEPVNESVILRWREKGLDAVFPGSALSSGTLRFVCLATLLQQPSPPATIVLDEPELGLHPFAIHQLADLLRETAVGRRIVVATQSVTLLGQFTVDEIVIVQRERGATTASRPDLDALTGWLDDYSLGELWEMNLLGGRPQAPEATVTR